jgi:RHS repeat-associated protein
VRVLGTDDWITSVTYYDEDARPIYSASKNDYLVTVDKVKSDLDFAGKVLQTESTHKKDANPVITITDVYTYDHVGRLQTQVQTIAGNDPELIVNNHYDELGQLVAKNVGGEFVGDPEDATGLQTVDYKYNIRGWLKTINNGNTINNDLFSFQLDYNTGVNPLYNGNISETHWQTANDHNPRSYNYTYDALNRLKMANYNGNYIVEGTLTQEENYNLDAIGYDKNGNITVLERQGLIVAENRIDLIDDLTYDYQSSSNKLIRVTDDASVDGFKDGTTSLPGDPDYEYDINGNLTVDTNKNITDIIYNHLNLPELIIFSSPEGSIGYKYSATGVKLEKMAMTVGSPGSVTSTQYAGAFIYDKTNTIGGMPNPNPPPPPVFELQFISHPEGYAQPNTLGTFDYIYQYKDHLGNIRLSYKNNGNMTNPDLEILEENNFYPFGLKQKGYNNNVSANSNSVASKFKYNGKELNEELGLNMYDYGARMYDPAIGRWHVTDGKAELYFANSPYVYALNTPPNAIDPDGNLVIFINGLGGGGASYWRSYESKIVGYSNARHGSRGRMPIYRSFETGAFDRSVMDHLGDHNSRYIDGSPGSIFNNFTSGQRFSQGYENGSELAASLIGSLARDPQGNITETIKIITHSMGGVYGKGFVSALKYYIKTSKDPQVRKALITLVADFDPFQAGGALGKADKNTYTQQYINSGWWDIFSAGWLANQEEEGAEEVINNESKTSHFIETFSGNIDDLQEGSYEWDNDNEEWICTSCKNN